MEAEGTKQMEEFNIGDTVRIAGSVMPGSIETVVSKYEEKKMYLVRVTDETQYYYLADELERFRP